MKNKIIISFALISFSLLANAQSLKYKGDLILGGFQSLQNSSPKTSIYSNYIPQLNYKINLNDVSGLSFEASADIKAWCNIDISNKAKYKGEVLPYRLWGSFSKNKLELRLGLQQINFGSAQLFRPLQWFDGLDPLDPTKKTKGVWGLLSRYYFENNANIWLWALTGNKDRKGMEILENKNKFSPEFGARVQLPISEIGEAALTYNYRSSLDGFSTERISENRFGADMRFDYVVGSWIEFSANKLSQNITTPIITIPMWQKMLTIGCDYSLPISDNLLVITGEHFVTSAADNFASWKGNNNISGLSLSYTFNPIISGRLISVYSWDYRALSANAIAEATWDNIKLALRAGILTNSETMTAALSEKMPPSNLMLIFTWSH